MCIFQTSLLSSIPLLVSRSILGTAIGVAQTLQMAGIGVSNLVVGQILGDNERFDQISFFNL